MSIVAVECFADKCFFGRLLENEKQIRKEKNKNEVIKAFNKVKDNFLIGIVDEDRKDLLKDPNLKDFELIKDKGNFKVYKDKNKAHFIFALSPKAFEDWINKFIEKEGGKLSDFGYEDFDAFKKETKNYNISADTKFRKVVNYILGNYLKSENHIKDFKEHIDYLIKYQYNFNVNEFQMI